MDNKIIITLFICLMELTIKIESVKTPVIHTAKGPVQGEISKTAINSIPYSAFKGIPYAEPPVGYLRFKPPIEKKSWTDVLFAEKEGANCVQKDFVYSTKYTGSEDCLYLNVYTPKLQFKNNKSHLLTVMVWIYGGSFKSGYGNSSLYGPDYIIENNVILVTFNYRLGPLGFLYLNHKNATGNAALKDQNLVLRWVRDNIEKFGGNPKDVTIFGQSAGGVSVDLHVLSDLSRGLFHRAIAMSSSPLCPWAFQTPEVAYAQAFTLGNKFGKVIKTTDELLKTLYKASALEIMQKTNEMSGVDPPFKPTIESTNVAKDEEKFLTKCPYEKYLSKDFNKVAYIVGFTSNETLSFAHSIVNVTVLLIGMEGYLAMTKSSNNIVESFPSNIQDLLLFTNKSKTSFNEKIEASWNSTFSEVIKVSSDILFVAGIDYKRKLLQSLSSQPVYMYRFAYESDESLHKALYGIEIDGAGHGDDFGYLFYSTLINQSMDSKNPSFITRQRMARLWTNFAKYGNPTPAGKKDTLLQEIIWPSTSHSNSYLEIETNLSIRQNPADRTASLVEQADVTILPVQTGCVTDSANKILSKYL